MEAGLLYFEYTRISISVIYTKITISTLTGIGELYVLTPHYFALTLVLKYN